MTQRKIKPGAIGADVDLDAEEVYLADGRRLTEQVAEDLAQRALARHRGRPSVTGERARPGVLPFVFHQKRELHSRKWRRLRASAWPT